MASQEETKVIQKKRNIIIVLSTTMCVGIAYGMFNPVFSMYVQTYGLSANVAGIIIAVATFLCLFGRIGVGSLYLKKNPGTIIRFSLGLMLAAYLFLWISSNLLIIIIAEIIQVFGMGMSVTALSTLAVESTAEEKLGSGVGIFNLSVSFAQSIAPAIGAYYAGKALYKTLFLSSIIVTIIGILLSCAIKTTKRIKQKAVRSKRKGGFSLSDYISVAALPAAILLILYSIAYSSVYSYVSLCGSSRGISQTSLFFVISSVMMIITRLVSGKMLDKKEIGYIIIPGYILMICALLVIAQANTLLLFGLGAVLNGIGFCTVQTALQVMAVRSGNTKGKVLANSTYYVGGDLGLSVGAYIAGSTASAVGYTNMYILMAVVSAVGMFTFLWLYKKRKI